jgi:CheY-like chemotaxis protein
MPHLVLVHWHAGEARVHAAKLERGGHRVTSFSDPGGGEALRAVRQNPPDAFVIVLDRLPSHGRAVGEWLRQQKATRHLPLVFVGGKPEKIDGVRRLLPDATYAQWPQLRRTLQAALRRPPANPVVPGPMAGYSGTPLPRKLGIRADSIVALVAAPADFSTTLGSLPAGATLRPHARGTAQVVVLFVRSRADLARRFPAAARATADPGRLWIAWPKKTSRVQSDLSEPDVRGFGLARHWVDYKICAIDSTWSGLCFARRDR